MKSTDIEPTLKEPNYWDNSFGCLDCIFCKHECNQCLMMEHYNRPSAGYDISNYANHYPYCPLKLTDKSIKPTYDIMVERLTKVYVDFAIILYANKECTIENINARLTEIQQQVIPPQYVRVVLENPQVFQHTTCKLKNSKYKYSVTYIFQGCDIIAEGIRQPKCTWTLFWNANECMGTYHLYSINKKILVDFKRELIWILCKNDWHGLCLYHKSSKMLDYTKDCFEQIQQVINDGYAIEY